MSGSRSAPATIADPSPPSAPAPEQGAALPESRVRRRITREIAVFLMSGGIAALVNLGTGALVRTLFGVGAHTVAVVAGFAVGTLVSFLLNRELTFRARRDHVRVQATRFVILAVCGIVLAAGVAELALRVGVALIGTSVSTRWIADAAHLVSIGTATITNFIGMKYYALRQ